MYYWNDKNPAITTFFLSNISRFQVLQHLNKVNFTTPRGENFYFQGSDMTTSYDLVNWQKTPDGPLKLALVGRVDGFNLILNESAIQWSTGLNQVVGSTGFRYDIFFTCNYYKLAYCVGACVSVQ